MSWPARRLAAVTPPSPAETSPPPPRWHVVTKETDQSEEEAIDAYGRHRIAEGDCIWLQCIVDRRPND